MPAKANDVSITTVPQEAPTRNLGASAGALTPGAPLLLEMTAAKQGLFRWEQRRTQQARPKSGIARPPEPIGRSSSPIANRCSRSKTALYRRSLNALSEDAIGD